MVVDQLSDAEVDRLFHALADATRRDIVRRVIDGEQSVVFDEAENRLHTQKAVMILLIGG